MALANGRVLTTHYGVRRDTASSAVDAPPTGVPTLLKLLHSPACLMDGAFRISEANEAWIAATIDLQPGTSSSLAEFVHPEERPTLLEQFRTAMVTGGPVSLDARVRDRFGATRWHRLAIQPAGQAAQDKYRWLCIGTDVHHLKLDESDLRRRASIQADMLNVSVDCIKLIALDGTLVHMNKAGCLALNVPEDSSFGMAWLPLLPNDVWTAGEEALDRVRNGSFARFPGRSVLPGQAVQYWDNMLTPVKDERGQTTAILCVSREVTAEREALGQLRESQDRLTIAAAVGGLGIWDYDIANDRLSCDATWYATMGRDPELTPVHSIGEFRPFIHPEDAERATQVDKTARELVGSGRDYAIDFRIIRPDGETRWIRSAASLVKNALGEPTRAIGFVIDVTESRRSELALLAANDALTRQSMEDPLTGISNRRHLDSEIRQTFARAVGRGQSVCVCMIDVDHFKAYNDRYGHQRGDEVLRKVAGLLRSTSREGDMVARYGGEEFVLVMAGINNPRSRLLRLRNALADLAIEHEASPTGVLTFSCGCAVVGAAAHVTPEQALSVADKALYGAKAAGRDTISIRRAMPPNLPAIAAAARPAGRLSIP